MTAAGCTRVGLRTCGTSRRRTPVPYGTAARHLTRVISRTPFVTVHDAIAAADSLLPGQPAPEGNIDPRWQAIIEVGEFVETEPEPVWSFIVRWGSSSDEDLR